MSYTYGGSVCLSFTAAQSLSLCPLFLTPTKLSGQESHSGFSGPHTTDLLKILAVRLKDISYYIMLEIFLHFL